MGILLAVAAAITFGSVSEPPRDDFVENLIIYTFDEEGRVAEAISPLFNPKEYTIEKMAPQQEHHNGGVGARGLDNPELQFTTGEARVLSMQLVFESQDETRNVKDYTMKIHKLAHVDGDLHRPETVLVTWGKSLAFEGVLTHVEATYSKFQPDGRPLRCVMNVRFTEFTPPEEQLQRGKFH